MTCGLWRLGATIAIFAATLALAIGRPRRIHEAVWTCSGAAAMLLLRLVSPYDVVEVLGAAKSTLLFLLALLLLSALLEVGGFFEWAAIRAALLARGDARALYRNVFVLGAAITALLSLDTTAVILTPLVLTFVRRVGVPARPYVFACAFVANTASLPLPISNLTNLLFASAFHMPFGAFAARMVLPQLVALALTFVLLRWHFRAELPATFAVAELPAASSVVPHQGYFRASVGALALVCAGYFVAPLAGAAPYVPAFAVAALLGAYGIAARTVRVAALVRHIGWSVFAFVIGLFVVVRGVENLGFASWAVSALHRLPRDGALTLSVVVGASATLSNLVNNLPAALLVRGVLQASNAPPLQVYGALIGTNIGPDVMIFGSLATILVLGRARERGAAVGSGDFVRVGLLVTPAVLVAATGALALVSAGVGR